MDRHTADVSVDVAASPEQVWEALTDPGKVAQYYLGATVETDWEVGSPISWSGEWNGKPFADKGEILIADPNHKLAYTHWSPLSGTADEPDNYHVVEISLGRGADGTAVRLMQSNLNGEVTEPDRNARAEYEKNWKTMLEGLKEVVEGEGRSRS